MGDSNLSRARCIWLALAACLAAPGVTHASFQLGLQDPTLMDAPSSPGLAQGYRVLAQVKGGTVRLTLPWAAIAPAGSTKPAGFDAANPADPRYRNWTLVDGWIKSAAHYHANAMLTIVSTPVWAQGTNPPAYVRQNGGSWNPNPRELAAFARAAALRYSGRFADPAAPGAFLPRVRFWEIWNEENLPQDLGAPNPIEAYRGMLNASYAAIKAVDPQARIVLGGFAPVSFEHGSISPLRFAAQLLCLRRNGPRFARLPSCPQPARFDIFSMHPYTLAATPTKPAYRYDDVLVADMHKIGTLVQSADRLHTVLPSIRHSIWVTEWSWFTNPPQRVVGDSPFTAARYTAYSMYEMWRAGTSMLIWFIAQDPSLSAGNSPLFVPGGGLYDRYGHPKPMLSAFEFPLIASVQHGSGYAWGRSPTGGRTSIVIQRRAGRRWQPVSRVQSGSDGVFSARFRARSNGVYRARVVRGATSLAYDSRPIPAKRTHLVYSG